MHATKSTAAAAPRPEPGRRSLLDALKHFQRGVATVNAVELRALRSRDAQATVIARAPRIGDAK
ncbi:MAG: hypothetical protein IT454_10460 [Planctomycetes bacterium]|nr:hypothetical protein [Planctomycetota bacterium]